MAALDHKTLIIDFLNIEKNLWEQKEPSDLWEKQNQFFSRLSNDKPLWQKNLLNVYDTK